MKVLAIIALLFAVSESRVTHPIPYSVYVSLGGLPYPEALRAKEHHTYTLEELYDNTTRIVGGTEAAQGELPTIVSLQTASHRCGGTIISPTTILCAAHCTVGMTTTNCFIRHGSNAHGSGGTRVVCTRIISHAQYSASTIDYDVSVVHVPTITGITPMNQCRTHPADGTPCIVWGWGSLSSGGSCCPANYRKVTVPVVPTATCNAGNSYNGAVTARMFCAGVMSGGQDSCQGDSGGPVIVGHGTANQCIAGIVSWGRGCAGANYPGVYTKVENLNTWIDANKT